MMQELTGKVVAVTGASRGLGEAMAVGFSRAGADLALMARTAEDLDRVAARCRQAGAGRVISVPMDVTAETDVQSAFERIVTELGGLDVVIANAGVAASSLGAPHMRKLESYSSDVALRILQVNTLGVWLCMKAAFSRMPRGGSFLAVSSELGSRPGPGGGILAVSKAGVNALVAIAVAEQAEA
ncbi:MAG: SDR family oxidoreductase, partial [Microbacteriaceae bacterium]